MAKRDRKQSRLLFLGSLIIALIFVYISQAWLFPTITRYIKREQDEIRAHYTALHFASTGEGKTITLEDSVGYIDFDLRNYVGEKVTQRDIVYTISKPSVFYDSDGEQIAEEDLEEYAQADNLHVLDVWGEAKKVAKSSYLYDVEIVRNTGEVVSENVYTFTYEKLGDGAKGKVHTLTCKVTRTDGSEPLDDTISLVVQFTKPYKEVYIINMKVSNRLITFSCKEISMFDIPMDKIYIQTADLFAYHKGEEEIEKTINVSSYESYKFTPYAFKLTITWSGYILDEDKMEDIHIGTSSYPGGGKNSDGVDSDGIINNDGTTPNEDIYEPYLDIEKSTIAKINSTYDVKKGHRGEMIIFVPQGSDIFFFFMKSASSGTIDVKIETYVTYIVNDIEFDSRYEIYSDTVFSGYEHIDEKYNLTNYSN